MMGVPRQKSGRDLRDDARVGGTPPAYRDLPLLPNESNQRNLPSIPTKPLPSSSSSGLPDIRLSRFDMGKLMEGMGAFSTPSSSVDGTDDFNWQADSGNVVNVQGNHRNSPRPYQTPPASARPNESPQVSPRATYSSRESHPHSQRPQIPTTINGGYSRTSDIANAPEVHRTFMTKSRSHEKSGWGIDSPRSQSFASPPASPHRQRTSQTSRALPHRSSADYYASPNASAFPDRTEDVARWVVGANESEDQRRAREWEEARERQHAADRKERYEVKAKLAKEESERRRTEFEEAERKEAIAARQRAADYARRRQEEEEAQKRAIAAARVEREQRERETEAERLREQERRWQERQAQKREEEARRRDAERLRQEEEEKFRREEAARQEEQLAKRREEEEKQRVRKAAEAKRQYELAEAARLKAQQEAEQARLKAEKEAEEARIRAEKEAERRRVAAQEAKIRAAKEAEEARLRKIEMERLARLKAIEDAEKARLKAIEDEKKRIEKAKQDYVRAISNGHAAIVREDREHVSRAKYEAERRNAWMEAQQRSRLNLSQGYYSSDSGVSLPSPGSHEHQERPDGNGGNLPFSLHLPGFPANNAAHNSGPPTVRFQQPGDPQNNRSPPTLPASNPLVKARKQPHLRFTSALTHGARSGSQSVASRSNLNFAPAIRVPWDAGIIGEGTLPDYNPSTLASVAISVALADVSDPTKPILSNGWQSHGYGDPALIKSHYTVVEIKDTRLVKRRFVRNPETGQKETRDYDAIFDALADPSEFEEVWEEFTRDELVFDLFAPLFSRTTPDVLERIVAHLDCADIKALRQSCSAVRAALDSNPSREVIVRRFLEPIGYQTWQDIQNLHGRASSVASASSSRSSPAPPTKLSSLPERDPIPLTFHDIEGFLLSSDLLPEYTHVSSDWLSTPQEMDFRVPKLARASTRAYSRVLARLRLQPSYKTPSLPPNLPAASSAGSLRSVSGTSSPVAGKSANGRAASPLMSLGMFSPTLSANGTISPSARSVSSFAPPPPAQTSSGPTMISPWKPGRVAVHRVWVPCRNRLWQSDEEVAKCERELFLARVWSHLKKGDIIRNTAMAEEANIGKLIFDGRYLRDLSFAFDRIGHIPSWLNLFLYPPAYYHNVIKSSTSSPVLYLDILPWREQIVSSLRLVQDQVETVAPNGARYRISKWLYRTTADVKASQIISDEGFQCVDEGWEGKLVFETEGTSEHAKDLIARCAGPTATSQTKAKILAAVLGQNNASSGGTGNSTTDPATSRDSAVALLKNPAVKDREGKTVQMQTPFAVLRDRSRPGLIWLRPVQEREKLV